MADRFEKSSRKYLVAIAGYAAVLSVFTSNLWEYILDLSIPVRRDGISGLLYIAFGSRTT